MSNRYVCVHGHFYQPPRENAWLESIELQESAYPNHDWNERITDECYGPNGRARILDDGWIVNINNNYARISFNFGPTVLAWMQFHAPGVYARIIEADRESMDRFSGHGSAIAQGYNHVIMPLCNDRDRATQVRWGIADFRHRFGRDPEGMWLPETAVSTATLEVLAEHDIKFTILAPRQADAIREIGTGEWEDVNSGIDPSRAYLCNLPSGKSITLFFYDGPVSQAVAFEGLLHSGPRFAARLMDIFDDARPWPQLAHIATDGESYGHHHRHGDMALAAALDHIESSPDVRLTNYGEFLSLHPPTHEVRIHENSSWSCIHGVERWRSDCGCQSGAHPEWRQAWRRPLREALDYLRDSVIPLYEKAAAALLRDPWAARDAYISIILDRSPASLDRFLAEHAVRPLNDAERSRVLQLLELQRHAMLMYTSCGWFFDDISGIETVQVIQYAGRVIQLAKELLAADFEPEFLARLEKAKGNVPGRSDGRQVYLQAVKPAAVDLARVCAHYAVSSVFEDYKDDASVFCYDVHREESAVHTAGRARLCLGRVTITSRITLQSGDFSYAVLHLGDHTLNCGVQPFPGHDAHARLVAETREAFNRADFAGVLRVMDRGFGDASYSIASLFRDEQHRVVRHILAPTLKQIDGAFQSIYEQNAPLLRFLRSVDLYVPRRITFPATFVLNQRLREMMASDTLDVPRLRAMLDEALGQGVELESRNLAFTLEQTLERLTTRLGPDTPAKDLADLAAYVDLAIELPLPVDLWQVQDLYYNLLHTLRPQFANRAGAGDADATAWLAAFDSLGKSLKVRMT